MLQQLEQPIHPRQKKQVVDAIHASGLKITPAIVAEVAGLPVLVAAQELNQIATETGAHLEVTAGGGVNYVFDSQFERAYSLSGPKKFARKCLRILANGIFILIRAFVFVGTFLLRISFGLLLVASVVALFVIIVAAIVAALQGDSGGGGGGGDSSGGGGLDLGISLDGSVGDAFASQWSLNYWCFDWLWDWVFFPRYMWGYPYYSYSLFDTYYDYGFGIGGSAYTEAPRKKNIAESDVSAEVGGKKKKPRTKFLDSCFALLFGADDPNRDFIQTQWNDVTRTIRLNHGVVIAEQLAPFVQGNKENEDWMLPILLRLNGLPDVSEQGNIIYIFPSFMNLKSEQSSEVILEVRQSSEAGQSSPESGAAEADQLRALYTGHLKRQKVINENVQSKSTLEPYLLEKPLTLIPEDGEYESVFLFIGLAIALSLGCLSYSGVSPLIHSLVPLFYCILGYSSLFLIFPGIRYLINGFINKQIEERNNNRLEASAQINNPSPQIAQKLHEAHVLGIAGLSSDANKVVYTTAEGLLEQQIN
jgi:hypothetical protein